MFSSTMTLNNWRIISLWISDGGKIEAQSQFVVEAEKYHANLDAKYDNSPETDDTISDEKGNVYEFTKKCVHLVSTINFIMDDEIDPKIGWWKKQNQWKVLDLFGIPKKFRYKPR